MNPPPVCFLGKHYPDNNSTLYDYYVDGKLHTRTTARNITTTYGYTPSGLTETISYTDGTPGVTMTYYRTGLPHTRSNGLALSTFTYDPNTLAPDLESISYNLDGRAGV